MGVYIKGIEMPKSCWDCPFMLHRSFCIVNTKIEFTDEEYSELKGRYIGCPLVSVPPHGRAINADRMIKDIKAQLHIVRLIGYKEPVMDEIANEIEKGFMQEIANAPTIIPADDPKEE